MTYQEFIKPELMILIPVIYIIGTGLKASRIDDTRIPLLLGLFGIAMSVLWMVATTSCQTLQETAMGLFVAVTQGILVAGASVYGNQLKKQQEKCACKTKEAQNNKSAKKHVRK